MSRYSTRERLLRILALVMVAPLLIGGCGGGDDTVYVYRDADTTAIGGIMALSGSSPVWGQSCLKALQFARDDINEALADLGSDHQFSLVHGDSATQPVVADFLFQSFTGQGVRVVIGPLTSDELAAMESSVAASNTVVISPSSTTTALAQAGDNIIRLVPNDGLMVQGIAQVLSLAGITSLAALYTDDDWGASILDLLSDAFTNNGGIVLGSLPYTNVRPDALQNQLDDLSQLISDRLTVAAADTIAFIYIGYDEGVGIMEMAAADAVLSQVRWFGTDGFVSDSLLDSATAAAFAAQTQYTAPSLHLTLTADGEALKTRIETAASRPATIYSLLAYDAFRVAADVLLNLPEAAAADVIRDAMMAEFASYEGSTGAIIFNAEGDRAAGSYYFYQVATDGTTYEWQHVYTYD